MSTPQSPTVLIVDDDHDIRASLRFLLEDAGYSVEEADTVDQGIAFLKSRDAGCIVLLDHLFPNETGTKLLRAAQAETQWGDQHVFIIMTASAKYAEVQAEVEELVPAQVPFVRKPFEIDDILDAVARAEVRLQGRNEVSDGASG